MSPLFSPSSSLSPSASCFPSFITLPFPLPLSPVPPWHYPKVCSGCGSSILACHWGPTTAATVVVHTVAVVILHSPVLHLSCTASPGGSFPLTYCGSSNAQPNKTGILTFIFVQNSKVSIFWGTEWTGEAGVLSDGGGKAKSQQIHLLSPAISQRNWRQFVSSWWQKIWKHYEKKPSGKTAVCVVTKNPKVIKRKEKEQLGETNMLFSRRICC